MEPDLRNILSSSLDKRWRRYCKELRRCQKKFSEDAVHDLRVATRRMVSTLDILVTLVPGVNLKPVRRELKRRFDALSPLRDTQVQIVAVRDLLPSFPQLKGFHFGQTLRERNLIRKVSKEIHRLRVRSLDRALAAGRARLNAWLRVEAQSRAALAGVWQVADFAFAKVVERHHAIDPSNTETIHRFRIAFKKFRYTLEALAPLLPELTEEDFEAMNAYQVRLGDIQDIEVLIASIKAYGRRRKKSVGDTLVPVLEELERKRRALIDSFLAAMDDVYKFWRPLEGGTRLTQRARTRNG
jgi:CHAD domain-containing protein